MERSRERRIAAILGLWLLGVSYAVAAAGPAPVTLTAGMESIPLAGHISVLRDEKGEWTIDDVRSPERAAQFTSGDSERNLRGYTAAAYWYRVTLRNQAGPASVSDWVLELGYPVLDYADFYFTRTGNRTELVLTGDLRHPPPEQLPHRSFAIPLKLLPGEDVTLHLRVQTAGTHLVELTAWKAGVFLAQAAKENIGHGAYFGILAVMALYNFIIFLVIRDRAYLYYVCWIGSALGLGLFLSGYARQYGNDLLASAPAMVNASVKYFWVLTGLFGVLFIREFLQTREQTPRMHRLLTFLFLVAAVHLLLTPLIPFTLSVQLSVAFVAAFCAVGLAVGAYLALKGMRAARIFLLAWGLVFAAVVVANLAALGVLPAAWFAPYTTQIATCLAVTLLSLALADRINSERREKFAASERASRLKSFLPQKVAELVVGGDNSLLGPSRRQVTVCVIDLRGFTSFSETSAPEDVMNVLRDFFTTMGDIVEKRDGTVEHFAGDSMLIFFNAPLEIPEPEKQAIQAALEMRTAFDSLRERWAKLGHELGLGIGLANGYATIGAIGFLGRSQYAAIGAVTNLASRLCSSATHGEILTTARVVAEVENVVESESAGEQTIRGFTRPVAVVRVLRLKAVAAAR